LKLRLRFYKKIKQRFFSMQQGASPVEFYFACRRKRHLKEQIAFDANTSEVAWL